MQLHNFKLERQTTHDRLSKLEDEVRSIKSFLGATANPFQQYSHFPASASSNLVAINDQSKRGNMNLNYGVVNSTGDGFAYDENLHSKRYAQKRNDINISIPEGEDNSYDGSHVIQLEKDTLKLRRDLQDALASRKSAESRILAYV